MQQLASATTASNIQVIKSIVGRQPSEEQASPQLRVRRSTTQKGQTLNKLLSILDKTTTFQEIELAVTYEEELQQSQSAVNDAQLRAYLDVDLHSFSATEIKNAKLIAVESLQGTYDTVSRTSLTAAQLQRVIQPTWIMQERSSKDGLLSLKARLVDTSFKQQLLTRHQVLQLHHT